MSANISKVLEALLFVSPRPVPLEHLARVTDMDVDVVKEEMEALVQVWKPRGVRIRKVAGGYQMVSAPEAAPYIEKLHRVPSRAPLTRAIIETLAIIAYRQPLTKRQIEKIRGVSADHAMQQLLERKFITVVGRARGPGRPVQYGTTRDFLKHFHIDTVDDLPPIENFQEPGHEDETTDG